MVSAEALSVQRRSVMATQRSGSLSQSALGFWFLPSFPGSRRRARKPTRASAAETAWWKRSRRLVQVLAKEWAEEIGQR